MHNSAVVEEFSDLDWQKLSLIFLELEALGQEETKEIWKYIWRLSEGYLML